MITDDIRNAQSLAYQYGANWVVASKEAEALASYPTIAAALNMVATEARSRYFGQLAILDELTGNTPSSFAEAG